MAATPDDAELLLDGDSLRLAQLETAAFARPRVALAAHARQRVEASRRVVDEAVAQKRVVYGVTTGFGSFAEVVVPPDKLRQLQLNLVRSHSAGVGEPLDLPTTRALMLLRANTLAKGFSGIRPETLDLLVATINAGLFPFIPSQGSVGASGDLAPLAHLALSLVGEGTCFWEGREVPSAEALAALDLTPASLEAKEGLALVNGTAFITALGGLATAEALRLARTADIAGAMSLDSMLGSDSPFDPRLQAPRPHPGQAASARNLSCLLSGSEIRESHRGCGKVQDAYSLRCIPQVHGACRDALAYVESAFSVELNAATDNPMVFSETSEVLSGGNFHGQPVAIAADVLTVAVAELGAISERRTERLMNPNLSGLPAFLVRDGGLNSGLMMAQVTAAALASENKALAHPASVDSIPTSADKEDHVSMGATAAWKASRAVANARRVLAVELFAASQALEFRRPLRTSPALLAVVELIRTRVPPIEEDRPLGPEIEAIAELVRDGSVVDAVVSRCDMLE